MSRAKEVAEYHERETMQWKRYQQKRLENPYEGDWGELVSDLSAIMEGRDVDQRSLRSFC